MNQQELRRWKVCVHCATYNHKPYIKETLAGFFMQQTNFPFVCVVVDDASSDGSQQVIRENIEKEFELDVDSEHNKVETDDYVMIFAQHINNHNCHIAFYELKYNHGYKKPRGPYYDKWDCDSMYVARCEGDDYWIDPLKLQKQADILDNNPSVMMVYSAFKTVDEKGREFPRAEFESFKNRSISGEVIHLLIKENFIMTLTVCMRSELTTTELYVNCPVRMDLSLFLVAAMYGDVYYMPEDTGCYRKVGNSMVNSRQDIVRQRTRSIRDYYSDCYLTERLKKVTFKQDRRILYSIANTCINDRYWRVFRRALCHPYFFVVFGVVCFSRLIKRIAQILNLRAGK